MAENDKVQKPAPVNIELTPVTIEISCNLNRSYAFPPAVSNLRGRWSIRNMGSFDQAQRGFAAMPDIPGMYVEIDPKAGKARVYDPLGLPKNKNLLDQINKVHKAAMGTFIKPVEETRYVGLDKDEVASWLYWMRRAVEGAEGWEENQQADIGPKAVIIEGSLPTLRECKRLGRVRTDYLDATARDRALRLKKELEAEREYAATA